MKSPSIAASCSIHVGREWVNYRTVSSVLIEYFFTVMAISGGRKRVKRDFTRSLGNGRVIQGMFNNGKWRSSYVSAHCRRASALLSFFQPSLARKKGTHVGNWQSPVGTCSLVLPLPPSPENRSSSVCILILFKKKKASPFLHQKGPKEDVLLT